MFNAGTFLFIIGLFLYSIFWIIWKTYNLSSNEHWKAAQKLENETNPARMAWIFTMTVLAMFLALFLTIVF